MDKPNNPFIVGIFQVRKLGEEEGGGAEYLAGSWSLVELQQGNDPLSKLSFMFKTDYVSKKKKNQGIAGSVEKIPHVYFLFFRIWSLLMRSG